MEKKDTTEDSGGLDDEVEVGAGASTESESSSAGSKPAKKLSPVKKFAKKFNVYFLIFIMLIVIAGAVTAVSYLNSKKEAPKPAIATQELNQETLKQLANTDATVGGSGQTLTIQGNAVFNGQILAKGDAGIAGTIVTNNVKVGTEITVPQITVSAKANLNDTQIASLQLSGAATVQGTVTLQKDLNVAGTASFSGPVTMGQLTVSRIVMSGNGALQIPNHISFPGASPGRSINPTVLGAGGTATINGSDTAGTINVNTGGSPAAGCFAKITFNTKYTSQPRVTIGPIGLGAGKSEYYVDRDTNGFSICTAIAAPANSVFAFDYFVTQ